MSQSQHLHDNEQVARRVQTGATEPCHVFAGAGTQQLDLLPKLRLRPNTCGLSRKKTKEYMAVPFCVRCGLAALPLQEGKQELMLSVLTTGCASSRSAELHLCTQIVQHVPTMYNTMSTTRHTNFEGLPLT
jgi:hypothetical protein